MFLFKRKGSPYWQIGWYNPKTKRNGSPISTGKTNRREAEQYLKDYRQDFAENKKLLKQPPSENILSDVFQLYIRDKFNTGAAYSSGTRENYDNALKYFYPACGNKPVSLYDKNDYHKFISAMDALSQNSKSIYSKCIYAMFNWMVKEELITRNPMKRITELQKEFKIKSKEEVDQLLNYARNTKFYWMVKFQLVSAFRIQEVLNFKTADIDFNIIRVKRKGSRYKHIPILKEMRKLLKEMPLPDDKNKEVFPFGYDSAWRFFKRFRKATGIDFRSHDCRKYAISLMANSGVPVNFTMHYAGHSRIETTLKHYIRTDIGKMADEINKKVNWNFDAETETASIYKIDITASKKLKNKAK